MELAERSAEVEDQEHVAFGSRGFVLGSKKPEIQLCVQADAGCGSSHKSCLRPARLNTALGISAEDVAVAVKYRNVQDALLYEYAKLIADAAIYGRPGRSAVPRSGSEYWSFVMTSFKRLKNGEISPSTILRENKLLVTENRECAYCGAGGRLEWEHLIPRSRGGPNTIDNLVLSCCSCNNSKGVLNPIEWYERQGRERKEIPRIVVGKLVKLVFEEHKRRGTLEVKEFPPGKGLTTAGACLVFDYPVATV